MKHIYTILIVDDDDSFRMLMRLWLERLEYRVVEASDGEEAIAAAERWLPAFILMDIGLPHRSGISAVYRIRKLPGLKLVPIIAVTGFTNEEIHSDAAEASCIDVLLKPFDSSTLEELLTTHLRDDKR